MKRVLSLLLAVLVLMTMCPIMALADEETDDCYHENVEYAYSGNKDKSHTIVSTCVGCGTAVSEENERCVDENGDLDCDLCGEWIACRHPNITENVVFTFLGENQHSMYVLRICDGCEEELNNFTTQKETALAVSFSADVSGHVGFFVIFLQSRVVIP